MERINTRNLKNKTQNMLNRLGRVNINTLSPEELTRYENVVSDLENKLQDLNIVDSVESEIRKNNVALKRIEASSITQKEIEDLISSNSNDSLSKRKIDRGIKYIQSVLQDAAVLEQNQDLTSLEQTVEQATQYLASV
jgi:hypothetical protein